MFKLPYSIKQGGRKGIQLSVLVLTVSLLQACGGGNGADAGTSTDASVSTASSTGTTTSIESWRRGKGSGKTTGTGSTSTTGSGSTTTTGGTSTTTTGTTSTGTTTGTTSTGSTSTGSTTTGSTSTGSTTSTTSSTLAAPTNVQIVLQGQDQQAQSGYNSSSNAVIPASPNHLTIAWKSVSGATSYNIYRSVNQGTYTLYTSVSPSAASTAYSSYVSNSGSYDHQTNVDSAYQDTAATNCVAGTTAAIVNLQVPSFGASNGYTYKVSAVNAAGEGTLSTDSIAIYFAGGVRIMNQDKFDGTLVYNDTTAPVPSPLGNTVNAKWSAQAYVSSANPGNPFINPYAGSGATGFNFNVKGFNYLVLNVMAGQSGSYFNMDPELEGDSQLMNSSNFPLSTKYGSLVANQWVTLKIPLSDLMTYQFAGTNYGQQFSEFYKVTLGSAVTDNYWIEWYFSVN